MFEKDVQSKSMIEAGKLGVVGFRQTVGKFRALKNEAVISVGHEGISDYLIIVDVPITADMAGQTLPVVGFAEFKQLKGKQRDTQVIFEAAAKKRGIAYRLIRSVEEMLKFVSDIKNNRWK